MAVTFGTSVCVVRGSAGIEEWHLCRHHVWWNIELHLTGSACLSRAHFLPRLPLGPRPARLRRSDLVAAIARGSLVGFLLSEATEAHLLLRVHQVDCAHREFREAVCTANRFPQRARIADVHAAVTADPAVGANGDGAVFRDLTRGNSGSSPDAPRGSRSSQDRMLHYDALACLDNAAARHGAPDFREPPPDFGEDSSSRNAGKSE